jgi:hypothetical protein
MSKSFARDKGQRGEREVIQLLQPVVIKVHAALGLPPPALERNLMQTNKGGYDIVGLEWMALEVKRQENLNLKIWWDQSMSQTKPGQITVLIYRKNNVRWRVMMNGYLDCGNKRIKCPVDISLDAFMIWFECKLTETLKG